MARKTRDGGSGGQAVDPDSPGSTSGARAASESDARDVLSAYAALVRVPNLFTAPPDVVLGAALASVVGARVAGVTVAGLAAASVLLYAAGTTLNDYFDAPRDARERPERPIPSGRVTRPAALALGATLLAGGVAVAFAVGGPTSGAVACALALAIVLYDGVFKGTAAGFLAMGSTRALNVLLGVTVAESLFAVPDWSLSVPLLVGAYVAAVTYMAAEEATGAERRAVLAAGVGAVGVAVAAVVTLVVVRPAPLALAAGTALAAVFSLWTGRALRNAYADPVPETVGPAVGACVLALVVLDAAFAAVAGIEWAAATLAFVVPAFALSRRFDVS